MRMLPELLIKNSQAQVLRSLIMRDSLCTVGRDASCSVVLPSPDISRVHGAFTHSAQHGVLSVEDLHSKNGVFVNGLRMRRSVLYAGDVVCIGNYKIYVRQGSSMPPKMGVALAKILAN
jgi:pSer/pThr/pTyr-binding forkhead associated (FHA) protein